VGNSDTGREYSVDMNDGAVSFFPVSPELAMRVRVALSHYPTLPADALCWSPCCSSLGLLIGSQKGGDGGVPETEK
jgi:hypothetical protein